MGHKKGVIPIKRTHQEAANTFKIVTMNKPYIEKDSINSSAGERVLTPGIISAVQRELTPSILRIIDSFVIPKKCYGCRVDHPSQRQHDVCIMMTPKEQLDLCLDEGLELIRDCLSQEKSSLVEKCLDDMTRCIEF